MKTFYYTDGKTNYGPFTIEELKGKGLSWETFVWTETFPEWKKAGEVPELEIVLGSVPPPIKRQQDKTSSRKIFDILLLVSLFYWLFNKLAHSIISLLINNLDFDYYKVYPLVNLVLTIIFVFIPVIVACSIENKTMKIIGMLTSAILAVIMVAGAVTMLIQMQQRYNY